MIVAIKAFVNHLLEVNEGNNPDRFEYLSNLDGYVYANKYLSGWLCDIDKAIEVDSIDELNARNSECFGKGGIITALFKQLSSIQGAEGKRAMSTALNYLKAHIQKGLNEARLRIKKAEIEEEIKSFKVDCGLTSNPDISDGAKSSHPIMCHIDRIHSIMDYLGYEYTSAPQIESSYYNFTALNVPEFHPARAEHDTYYIEGDLLLRSHTSNSQIRYLEGADLSKLEAGCGFYTAGKVYRRDRDRTHSPMFHQLECVRVDKSVTFESMIDDIYGFLMMFFNTTNVPMRIRPNYFPFTEPSAEIDIRASLDDDGCLRADTNGDRYIEILGCGLVHPNVFAMCELPDMPAWAFGSGIERLVSFTDIRLNDINALFN